LSVILASGLAGIREGYELPPEISADVHQMTSAERAAVGARRLPDTMAAALDLMEESDLVAEALGEHVFGWFLRNKRAEWERYQHHVSRFELETYLPIL
jgi:glutamine synthetase